MAKEFTITERVDNNFGKMTKLMEGMTREELNILKFKTQYAYEICGGDYFIHSLQLALINSYLAQLEEKI